MPFKHEAFDVVVAGGGPAGFGAAISAARAGASVLLVERIGQLGGVFTGAGVPNWCESWGGPVLDELIERVGKLGGVQMTYNPARQVKPGRPTINTELAQLIMMQMLREAGVQVLFLAWCERLILESGVVRGVEILSKSGRQIVPATVVIDATADADLAAGAGVPFELGEPSDGRLQHCNYRAWFEGIDKEAYQKNKPSDEQLIALIQSAHRDGSLVPPRNVYQPQPDVFPYNRNFKQFQFTAWEFANVDPLDALAMSDLLGQCHVATLQVMEFARKHLPGHEKISLRKLPNFLGVRESRRIVGKYRLTFDDVLKGAKFDDAIARAWFYADLHESPPGKPFPHSDEYIWSSRPARGDWYEVPMRCAIPQGIEGLLVAGRAMCVERKAFGSSRVMATCLSAGSGTGICAAMAVQQKVHPSQIDGRLVSQQLMSTFKPPSCEP